MNKKLIFLIVSFLYMVTATVQPLLIPYPRSIEMREGYFVLTAKTGIINLSDKNNARLLKHYIEEDININLHEQRGDNNIFLITNRKLKESLGAEGYRMNISADSIVIEGAENAGVFYGIQTLRQLAAQNRLAIPCMEIFDKPEYEWRDFMLDEARHFKGKVVVKQLLEEMAYLKMNKFHWHLTDDQGWRVEIKKYPRLTEVGSIRNKTMIRKEWDNYDTTPYGGFYTQDELRDMVKYAADLGITIIPEIDLPGHMMAALASYPELGCTGGPYEVSGQWGIRDDVLCVGKEKTFEFIENVLLEIIDIFPSKYIHIGGDECPKIRWEKCPACQARIQKLGLKDDEHGKAEHYLQSYTTERIEKFLNEHGREIIGWDEMLEGGLTTNATVMSWRGVAGGVEAAKQGHYAIMTPTAPLYLDYYQSRDTQNEPLAIGGYNPVDMVYNFNPIPESLTEEQAKFILGTQANIWTEYITTPEHLEYMILPRLAALSEVQWDQVENKSYDRFLDNIGHILAIYDVMGLNYAKHILEVKGEYSVNETKGCIEATLRTQGNAPIYYTLDGSEPTTNSTRYTEPKMILAH